MPSTTEPAGPLTLSEKTIFVPSGDHPASKAVKAVVVLPVCNLSFDRSLPSGWTVYREPKCSKMILVPLGDQLPSSSDQAQGVIRWSPLPSTFTTNKAWFLPGGKVGLRPKTICLPLG